MVSIGLRYGMILFIASEVMFFVAWFWIFFEMALFHHHRTLVADRRGAPPPGRPGRRRASRRSPPFDLPLVNTLILLLSGTTVTWAHHALQTGDRNGAKIGLLLTILLGHAVHLDPGVRVPPHPDRPAVLRRRRRRTRASTARPSSWRPASTASTCIIGTIFLTVCLLRLMGGGFTPSKHFGFEAAAWYWHFVDVVWLFLFTFVYVIFGASWQ